MQSLFFVVVVIIIAIIKIMEQIKKFNSIYDDYVIQNNVLGIGLNGKVLTCVNKHDGNMYAVKVRKVFLMF